MRYDRLVRAEQFVQQNGPVWFRSPDSQASEFMAQFAEAEVRAAVAEFVAKVNARAEADMLAGNPITGAHHRALDIELAKAQAGEAVPPGAPTP